MYVYSLSSPFILITRRTTPTSTIHALDRLILFQLSLRDSTYTGGIKVSLLGLDASKTAQLSSMSA